MITVRSGRATVDVLQETDRHFYPSLLFSRLEPLSWGTRLLDAMELSQTSARSDGTLPDSVCTPDSGAVERVGMQLCGTERSAPTDLPWTDQPSPFAISAPLANLTLTLTLHTQRSEQFRKQQRLKILLTGFVRRESSKRAQGNHLSGWADIKPSLSGSIG